MDDPRVKQELDAIVAERIRRKRSEIEHSLGEILAGNPMAAEPDAKRRIARGEARFNELVQKERDLKQWVGKGRSS